MKVGQHGWVGHGRGAGRGDPDGQWPRTVKVVLVHSYGLQNNDKVKELFHENHQLGKVVEMKGTDDSFVLVGFSRTEIERLKD